MASNINLGVDEDDIGELLEAVPEELTNEELLELEQEHVTEEQAREMETAREEKEEEPQRKYTLRVQQKLLQTSTSSLKGLKTWTPTPKGFH